MTTLTYVEIDGTPVVAGSNGGSDRPPAWLTNVRANPSVTVRVGRQEWPGEAVEIEHGTAEFEAAWHALNTLRNGQYHRYQERTDRPIPLVRLRRIIPDQ